MNKAADLTSSTSRSELRPLLPGTLRPRRHRLAGSLSPADATRWLRDEAHPVALIGEWLETKAVLGSAPILVASDQEDPFALLDEDVPLAGGEARVGGGWIGWLGYGLGSEVEELPPSPPAPCPRRRFSLAFYDHVIVYDEDGWWFEELWTPEREALLKARLELWRSRLHAPPPAPRAACPSPMRITANGSAGHLAAVSECRSRIAAGELFQANLCMRLEGALDGDLCDLFATAVASDPPRFGAWVEGTVSLSPERFLRRSGDLVSSDPIKGTWPRVPGSDEVAAREALEASAKDAAEHVMIVDLMRNDLGRVCRYGSVRAHERRVEPHAGVWHLVSGVSGQLRDGVGDGALLRATFPPGSVTGAPKVQAMKVISELEATRRELYTGAIGVVSPVAGLELSVAIRTFELSGDRIWLGVGGGIVADSDPERELAEALAKAAGPLAAVGGQISTTAHPAPSPMPQALPRALRHGRRPDPGAGVFETVLVEGGEPVALDEHLARLTTSLGVLYGRVPPADLHLRIAEALSATAGARSRLRITASVSGGIRVSTTPAPRVPTTPVALTPFMLPGGLGAHKWRDRSLLDALSTVTAGAVPLLVDSDGSVLEAAFANLWIAEQGIWITPPADGRILAGVTRARRLHERPACLEERLSIMRLRDADAIFISSSIGGFRRARLC